jgi:NarL family two-component system sensor histidine kinase LiaS
MSKKDVELQMLRERKHLSSEIHDNLSQMVSALAIRADIAQSCLEDGDDEAHDRELEMLANQARQVTKVLREEMLSLRAPIEGAGDVVADVAERLDRFQSQWGIQTHFSTSNASHLVVSEYVRLQLARIVNECLQNVLRHSRATEVQVTLERKNGSVLISIRDNGQGFDVAAVAPERLGIRIMRERAASSGGSLSVVSGSSGTTVFIEVPAAREQGGARG